MHMKKKILLYALVVFLVTCLLTLVFVISFQPKESVLSVKGESLIPLNRQSVTAHADKAEKKPYLFYRFTDGQRGNLESTVLDNKGAAVRLRLKFDEDTEGKFAVGFLYEDDFKSSRKLKKNFEIPEFVTFDYSKQRSSSLDVSVLVAPESLQKAGTPYGIVVYGNRNYQIENISFTEPIYGYDLRGNIPYYAFGDKVMSDKELLGQNNFEGLTDYFDNGTITMGFSDLKDIGSFDNQAKVSFHYGDESFSVRRSPFLNEIKLPVSAFNEEYARFDFTENESMVNALFISEDYTVNSSDLNGDVLTPISIDLGMVLSYPQKNWRCSDYELYEWQMVDHVLFFDFKDYHTQNQYLTRLAYFAEKEGYKGTLVSDWFVDNRHGYNAHDYKAKDLAAFFTKAHKDNFRLNECEQRLCRILVRNGIIIKNKDGSFSEGEGNIISIARESADYLRAQLMAHESWHGLYFTDEEFRNTVAAVYYMFNPTAMEFIKVYWQTQPGLEYDTADEYLMQNEFMAYLMQQALGNTKKYFINLSNRQSVIQNEGLLAAYVRDSNAQDFYDACAVLNDYVYSRWGLAAGRVNLFVRH